MLLEIKCAKQILINNIYSNTEIDMEIRKLLQRNTDVIQNPSMKTQAILPQLHEYRLP